MNLGVLKQIPQESERIDRIRGAYIAKELDLYEYGIMTACSRLIATNELTKQGFLNYSRYLMIPNTTLEAFKARDPEFKALLEDGDVKHVAAAATAAVSAVPAAAAAVVDSVDATAAAAAAGGNRQKKKAIPKYIKTLVWNKHIGENVAEAKCPCCKATTIHIRHFDCGHIVAEKNGGTLEITNLVPICKNCNLAMGTMDMREFQRTFGL